MPLGVYLMVSVDKLRRKIRHRLVLLAALFFQLFNVQAYENQVTDAGVSLKYAPSGSGAWIPYYIPNQDQPGIVPEITNLILHKANISAQPVMLPPKRTNYSLENGLIDFDFLNPQWLPSDVDTSYFIFSVPILPIKEYFVSLASSDTSWKDISKHAKKPIIGTVSGYYYHDDNLFIRKDYPSEKAIVQALMSGRINQAILGDLPALYWAEKLNAEIRLDQLHSDGYLHIRLRREHQHLLPQIDKAINELKQSKVFNRVITRYIK